MKNIRLLGIGALIGVAAAVIAPKAWQSVDGIFAGGNEQQANAGNQRRGRGGPGRGGYTPVVAMDKAEQAAVTRHVDVIGQVRALRSVVLRSETTGIVETINFKPGQRVEEGDILLQIDDAEQQVTLARAQAEYPNAKENAERFQDLITDASASAQEAEQAENAYATVRAQLRAAEVAVEQRKIRAPFDGIAGLTEIEPGDYLQAGDQLTTLDNTSAIVIEFSVPQESAAFVNIGQPVSVALTSAANIDYAGVITAIDSRVNSQSRTLRVEAEVDNRTGRLIPGAVVAVSTAAEGEPAIAIPGLALQWDRRGAYVWRRSNEGVAERVGVVILQRNEEQVLVEGELKVGDNIVSEGADRVRINVPLPQVESLLGGYSSSAAADSR